MGTVTVSFELLTLPAIRAAYDFDGPGIYFLFQTDELIYVGQTTNLDERLSGHIRKGVEYNEFHMVACPHDDLDVVEALYVRQYKPRLNRGRGGPGRKARRDDRLAKASD